MFVAQYRNTERGAQAVIMKRLEEARAQKEAAEARVRRIEMLKQEAEQTRLEVLERKASRDADLVHPQDHESEPVVEDTIVEKPSARSIAERIAIENGVSFGEVLGPSRNRSIVAVRHAAIRAVVNARPDMSLPQIGRVFNRDHTSILHAMRKTRQPGQPR